MGYVAEEFKHKNHLVKIVHDDCADNPITDDDVVRVVEWTRSYDLGNCEDFSDPEEFEQFCKDNKVHRLPLYLFSHSGVTVSTKPFGCQWDSGQVGWVFVTDKDAKENLYPDDKEAAEPTYNKSLEGTVESLDTWLTGNVWGYEVYPLCRCCGEPKEDAVESCWGFYGDPDDDVKAEAMSAVPDAPSPNVTAI